MGLYSRDYVREGAGGAKGRAPYPALLALTLLCVGLWIVQIATNQALTGWMAASGPSLLSGFPEVWRLLTSQFAHGGLWHLGGNLLAAWLFGRAVEDELGEREFWRFYLLSGALAVFVEVLWLHSLGRPNWVIGASGGVMALMAWFAASAPTLRVDLIFARVPRWVIAAVYICLDLRGLVAGGGNVAHLAHLSGAFVGVVFAVYGLRIDALWSGKGRRPERARAKRISSAARGPSEAPAAPRDAVSARFDELLAKISVVGMAGLSDEERAFLHQNSDRYRS
jgi:membrane associated rhomboid family serine protease